MKRHNFKYGIPVDTWDKAKEEARQALIEVASHRGTIFYSDLVKRITSCDLAPYGDPLAKMLGEISTAEDTAGSGLLTAVVVLKDSKDSGRPGRGFFDKLARDRGRDFPDTEFGRDRFWIEELSRVYEAWS